MTTQMVIEAFFDPDTWTLSYLVLDRESQQCALIDSVLDYDPKSGRTGTASADRMIDRVQTLGASVQWILETHVHADHLSAAPYLAARRPDRHRQPYHHGAEGVRHAEQRPGVRA
jgi:glyoxylase-like metal-dependent hydrolase (beta-lactamase superfamily II)